MITVPELTFVPAQPANLDEVLEAQVERLIEIGVPKKVGVAEGKFRDDAMTMAAGFVFSMELAAIGLDRVWFVHYDVSVSDRFLTEVGEVTLWVDPDKFTLFEGVTVPEGLRIVQGQFGSKYKKRSPSNIRQNRYPLERLGIPREGLTAFLYWGMDLLLRESDMVFPGAVSGAGYVPYLGSHGWKPTLSDYYDDLARPSFGSVSVSRGS